MRSGAEAWSSGRRGRLLPRTVTGLRSQMRGDRGGHRDVESYLLPTRKRERDAVLLVSRRYEHFWLVEKRRNGGGHLIGMLITAGYDVRRSVIIHFEHASKQPSTAPAIKCKAPEGWWKFMAMVDLRPPSSGVGHQLHGPPNVGQCVGAD